MQVTGQFLVFLVGTQARRDGETETVDGLTALTSQLNISLPNPEPWNKGHSLSQQGLTRDSGNLYLYQLILW